MLILPAIDLYEKKAVRLHKGDYAQMTVYNDHPLAVAEDFAAAGAQWIHIVDLEGARDGTTPNAAVVTQIVAKTGLHVELGGGIRSLDTARRYLDAGVSRIILGTAALTQPEFLAQALRSFGERVAVGVDCRDGLVAIRGWTQTSAVTCEDFCQQLQDLGVRTVICPDISKDGAMQGANRVLYQKLTKQFSIQFIASGGVSTLDDIRALSQMGLYGAIIGKAYYTGAIDLKKAQEAAQ